MEGGKEPNYWPGFVDALSNVVLTLVFVLVIFVFALLMASNKVKAKMQEVQAAEQAQKAGQAELDKALAELEQLRSDEQKQAGQGTGPETAQQQESCLRFNKSDASQKSEIDTADGSMLITFGANAISVTEDTTKAIHDYIEAYRAKTGDMNAKFVIESPDNPASDSPLLAREAQLGRMLNVRNSLLNDKIEARNITVHNTGAQQEKGTYNWVKIHVDK